MYRMFDDSKIEFKKMRSYYLLAALVIFFFTKEVHAQEYQMSFKIINAKTGIGVENAGAR